MSNNLRMKQRLTTRNRHQRDAAFFHSGEAFLGRQLLLQDVRRILHLAAAGTRQVAAEEWLKH